jgi:hypothetical protein
MPRAIVTAVTLPLITPDGAGIPFGGAEVLLLVWANEAHG